MTSKNCVNSSSSPKIPEPIRVAIVGGGVAGLSAAWHLLANSPQKYEVTVFESENRLGGHAYTIPVPVPADTIIHKDDQSNNAVSEDNSATRNIDVDVGFMVYNDDNYPNMTKWFEALGVESEKSDMSLSVSLDEGKTLEWSSDGISGLFAHKRQLLTPSFYTFLADMIRFHKEAQVILSLHAQDPRRFVSVGEYLRTHQYSDSFGRNYLLPMMAALWSASMEDVLNFPMEQLVGFMCNHKMLRIFDRPDWNTVKGRSRSYTEKMTRFLQSFNAMRTSTPIVKATKLSSSSIKYDLFTNDEKSVGIFDHIIFACHPPTAERILSCVENSASIPTRLLSLLHDIDYADNIIYLHSDPKLMPKRKAAWASWNCLGNSSLITTSIAPKLSSFEEPKEPENRMKAVYVTYYLNRLQNLNTTTDIFVSLNPHSAPEPDKTYKKFILAHPQFTQKTTNARESIEEEFQGKNNLWFAGAWSGYGFHEDGCRSGFHASTLLSQNPLPWVRDEKQMVLPPPNLAPSREEIKKSTRNISYQIMVLYCKWVTSNYFRKLIKHGTLEIRLENDSTFGTYGEGNSLLPEMEQLLDKGGDKIVLKVLDNHFFIDFATYGNEGIARSYSAGHFMIELLGDDSSLDSPVLGGKSHGLLQLLLLFNINLNVRCFENKLSLSKLGKTSIAKLPSIFNICPRIVYALYHYWKDKFIYLSNPIYYDSAKKTARNLVQRLSFEPIESRISNLSSLLLSSTSSALFDAHATSPSVLVFNPEDTLEQAHERKINVLLARLNITSPKMNVLLVDLSTSYGANEASLGSKSGVIMVTIAIQAVQKFGCKVYAILANASEYNTALKLLQSQDSTTQDFIKLTTIPGMTKKKCRSLRSFTNDCLKSGLKFDRILIPDTTSLIEKVTSLQDAHPFKRKLENHIYDQTFFSCMETALKRSGILILEVTTMNDKNIIESSIDHSAVLPSVRGLLESSYQGSTFTLEHMDNYGLQYSKTLKDWRSSLNSYQLDSPKLDDREWRAWNFYGAYCEAALGMHNLTSSIFVFTRPGCTDLVGYNEARAIMQSSKLSDEEVKQCVNEV